MDKRLQKRHKRQVSRAKEHVKLSEPDVRTPEEIKSAREASRPTGGRSNGPPALYSGPSNRSNVRTAISNPAKSDA